MAQRPPSNRAPDWADIRRRASLIAPPEFALVVEGLRHAAQQAHGPMDDVALEQAESGSGRGRHVSGQQVCHALREVALAKYGPLAPTVLRRWGLRSTEDFGVIVYALIDRGELRCSSDDRFDDFVGVYDFADAFALSASAIG
jgi:uncharacterized repeat protein (TIGR04138 family)